MLRSFYLHDLKEFLEAILYSKWLFALNTRNNYLAVKICK